MRLILFVPPTHQWHEHQNRADRASLPTNTRCQLSRPDLRLRLHRTTTAERPLAFVVTGADIEAAAADAALDVPDYKKKGYWRQTRSLSTRSSVASGQLTTHMGSCADWNLAETDSPTRVCGRTLAGRLARRSSSGRMVISGRNSSRSVTSRRARSSSISGSSGAVRAVVGLLSAGCRRQRACGASRSAGVPPLAVRVTYVRSDALGLPPWQS